MPDESEFVRRTLVNKINQSPKTREELEQKYGKVWNTQELQQDFEVSSFCAPFVVVRRKSDGVRGSLSFQHNPRFYFDFSEGK
jgi:hypothetical protein